MDEPTTVGSMAATSDEIAEQRREQTRDEIIQTAAKRLADNGYEATSLSDVAMLTGIEPATVAFHFPTKEDLVEAVLRAGVDHARSLIGGALTTLPSDATSADRLEIAIGAYLQAISQNQHVTRANIRCYRSVPPVLRRGLGVHMREFVETWTELLQAGKADGSLRADVDVPVVARMLIASLNSTITWKSDDLDATTTQVRTALLNGLRTT